MTGQIPLKKADLPLLPATGGRQPGPSPLAGGQKAELPQNLFRYVLEASGWHQLLLVTLSVAVFLLEVAPLELQRRIVNDLVKHRNYRLVILLCAIYVGVALVQGGTKLGLNIYRSWVGECATRDLRTRIRALVGTSPAGSPIPEASGIEVSMIVAEVEPVGGFVGESLSEPLLQGGVLLSVLAYMIHVQPGLALAALALFVPQLVFVPLMQHAINRRTGARVWLLRQISVGVVAPGKDDEKRRRADDVRIGRVFELNMGIFRLKFTMNFLMNLCNHLEIVGILLVGGWFVYTDQLEIGGVVAFITGITRLNDPWGDLVNYFRDMSNTQVKFRLIAGAINRFARGETVDG
jgi:ABC-type multidrug transport system fused ATPase/permease subunit